MLHLGGSLSVCVCVGVGKLWYGALLLVKINRDVIAALIDNTRKTKQNR